MKLYLKNLTWAEQNSIQNVFKTNFIKTIDGDNYINAESGLIDHMRKNGEISENKIYKDGQHDIRRCIRVNDTWYEFEMDCYSEAEYIELFYYS